MFKDFLKCLSFVNLLFLGEWSLLQQAHRPSLSYFRKGFPGFMFLGALVANILLLSVACWVLLVILRRRETTIASSKYLQATVLLVLVLPLNAAILELSRGAREVVFDTLLLSLTFGLILLVLRRRATAMVLRIAQAVVLLALLPPLFELAQNTHDFFDTLGNIAKSSILIGAALLLGLARPKVLVHFFEKGLLVISPLFFVSLSYVVWCIWSVSALSYSDRSNVQFLLRPQHVPRIVVMVFDEWDQRLTFENRPPGIELPEIDAFRSHSIYANSVFSPGTNTIEAIPSILTGRVVSSAVASGTDGLTIKFEDSAQVTTLALEPNLFTAARALGANCGLAGWYHPYCRILKEGLSECSWEESMQSPASRMKENAMRRAALVGGMYQLLRGRFDSWFESDPEPSSEETTLPDELMSFVKSSQLRSYKSILDASRQMVTNPNLSLVFIHWPTPHAPGIYDRVWNKFSLESGATYFDNMELVDRTLGEVRRDMQQAGVWDQATVLITSDHSLRTKLWQSFPGWTAESRAVAGVEQDPRVPFLLKLQGQKTGVTLDQPFSNVIIHDLVLALLRRQLPNPAAIASWLQAETGRASALQAGDLSSTDQRSQAERSKSTRQPARAEVTLLKNGE